MTQNTKTEKQPSKTGTTGFPETPVHIIDSAGHTDNDHADVWQGQGHVRWFANDRENATIRFDYAEGSPFSQDHFDVPAGGSIPSGTLKPGVPVGNHYRYTVYAPKGSYDPEVIIR